MTNIPEHLIEAVESAGVLPSNGNDQQDRWAAQTIITIVLGALRPEDAHLVPAWRDYAEGVVQAVTSTLAMRVRERDEARVESDRRRVAVDGLKIQRDEARAEVERLKTDTVDWPATLEGILRERDEARAEVERLKAENALLLKQIANVAGKLSGMKQKADKSHAPLAQLTEEK